MSEQTQMQISPVGRLVQGDPFKGNWEGFQGRKNIDNDGNPFQEWYIGVAFQKADPAVQQMIQAIQQCAAASFPNGEHQRPDFSWKIVDGDTQPEKEGFAGNFVISFKSRFAPQVFRKGGRDLAAEDEVKRGHFIRVAYSVKGNGQTGDKAGMFINLHMVEHIAFGEEIKSGPGGALFAQAEIGALPPGASTVPPAPAHTPAGFVAPQADPQPAPAPLPDYGFLNKPAQ